MGGGRFSLLKVSIRLITVEIGIKHCKRGGA